MAGWDDYNLADGVFKDKMLHTSIEGCRLALLGRAEAINFYHGAGTIDTSGIDSTCQKNSITAMYTLWDNMVDLLDPLGNYFIVSPIEIQSIAVGESFTINGNDVNYRVYEKPWETRTNGVIGSNRKYAWPYPPRDTGSLERMYVCINKLRYIQLKYYYPDDINLFCDQQINLYNGNGWTDQNIGYYYQAPSAYSSGSDNRRWRNRIHGNFYNNGNDYELWAIAGIMGMWDNGGNAWGITDYQGNVIDVAYNSSNYVMQRNEDISESAFCGEWFADADYEPGPENSGCQGQRIIIVQDVKFEFRDWSIE